MSADPAVNFRLQNVEERGARHETWLLNLDTGHGDQAVTIGRHEERIQDVEQATVRLADTVNKGVWALVGFSLTVAASAVTLALTVGGPT